MALVTAMPVALAWLTACAGDQPRPEASPTLTPASTPTPSVRDLFNQRSQGLVVLALTDDSDGAFLPRLEAMRELRRARFSGCASALVVRAERSRTDIEQAEALDTLFACYPREASAAVARLAEAFAGETAEERRLADVILTHRDAEHYGVALRLLRVANGPEPLFHVRHEIVACGEPMLDQLRPLIADGPLGALARMLAAAISGGGDLDGDLSALRAAGFPHEALRAFVELHHQAAIPGLRAALDADGPDRAEAVLALGELGDGTSSDAIRACLRAAEDVGTRCACLLALGQLGIAEAAPDLIAACDDATEIPGATYKAGRTVYGGPTRPVAQAAVAGLAKMPGEAAYEALTSALRRSDRPLLVEAAAAALSMRGDARAVPELERAQEALAREGHAAEFTVADAIAALSGHRRERGGVLVYVVSYRDGGKPFTIIVDQPLLPVDGPGQVLLGAMEPCSVSQESFTLTEDEIAAAINMRNHRTLDRLGFGGQHVDDVDLLAR